MVNEENNEVNRSESDRCIEIAIRHMEKRELDKAIKFLEKSKRLYPNTRAQNLIDEIVQLQQEEGREEKDAANEPGEIPRQRSSSGPRQRRKQPASPEFAESRPGTEGSSHHGHKDYTPDQHEAVTRVIKCKTFYQVLQIEKETFSEGVLKKQYRKLALVLHPDKNKAPHAGEAFKIVGKAYAVLSNPQKKADYDRHGDNYDSVQTHNPGFARQQTRRRYYRQGNFMFFEDDVSADDVFNMFFGFTRFPDGRYQQDEDEDPRAHAGRHQGQQRQASPWTLLLQLSPLLLFLGLSALSSLTYSEPVFSLHQSNKYPHQRTSRNLDVRFFLKDEPDKLTNKELHNIEQNVEELYLSNLKEACLRERAYKENVMWRGRLYGDQKLVNKGRELETPSCDNLSRAYNRLAAV